MGKKAKKKSEEKKKYEFIPKVDSSTYEPTPYLSSNTNKYLNINYGSDVTDENLTSITIDKRSFMNHIAMSIRYINYFIEFFDERDELLTSYLITMYAITIDEDEEGKSTKMTIDKFINHIQTWFGTKYMIDNITKMVEHNVDMSIFDTNKSNKGRKANADESLQLTPDHLKAMMAISVVHRMIIPMVSAFEKYYEGDIKESGLTLEDFHFMCFGGMVSIFDEHYDVKMYDKLHHTSTTRVSKTTRNDRSMWGRRERFGVSHESFANRIIRDFFIDISQKTIFSKSAINYIHSCFDRSIRHELLQQDLHEFVEITADDEMADTSDDKPSSFMIMSINNARTDISKMSRSKAMIKDLIKRCKKEYDVDVSDEAIDYYYDNTILRSTQMDLVFNYFSTMIGQEYLSCIDPRSFMQLTIILKAILHRNNYRYLPYILVGNIDIASSKKINKRRIQSYMDKHPSCEDISKEYSHAGGLLDKAKQNDRVRDLLSTFTVVDYELHLAGELDDSLIDPSNEETVVVDEIMRLVNSL